MEKVVSKRKSTTFHFNLIQLLFLVFLALLVSCSSGNSDRFNILSGVFSWARQDWNSATASFLKAAEAAEIAGDLAVRDYAVYGLAATYLAQEEYDAALLRLAEISDNTSEEILAGIWYQIGIAAYRKGKYTQAADYFKKNLTLDPSAMDSKINLELCHRSMLTRESGGSTTPPGVSETREKSDESEILFNLVRRKEQERWKNQQAEQTAYGVEDY